jgi:putative ABC transport system permease protein
MGLMMQLMWRSIRRRRSQSLLFVLGIALGVAVGVAIDLANTSASRAFLLSTENLAGTTTHQVIGNSSGFDQSIYPQLQSQFDYPIAPIVEGYVRGVEKNELPLRLVGVEVTAENPFRTYSADTGQNQAADLVAILSNLEILGAENPILISEGLAARYNLALGDQFLIRPNTEQVPVTIIGLLRPNDSFNAQALDDLLLTDLRTAQGLLNQPGRLTRLDLILPENQDTAALEAALPEGLQLTTPARRVSALNQMLAAFQINLQALSLLALVVGIFLIYNTVMFSVVQRRKVLGIMRSLGTSRRQIFTLVMGEAAFLGGIGTILGLLLGIIMAQAVVGIVSQTVSDLYFRVNVQTVTLSPWILLRGAAIGITASLIAAAIPAYEATRTTPAGSMRRSDLESGAAKLIPYITILAFVLISTGALLLQIEGGPILISFAALFAVVNGAALLTPLGMLLIARAIGPLMGALFGVLGRMAPRALTRSISRTSIAVAALTLAVSVIVGVGVMVSSFRATVVDWLEITLGADIFIATPRLSTDSAPNIDPVWIDRVAETEGVAGTAVVRNTTVIAPDYPDLPPARVVAVDVDLSHGKRRFLWQNIPAGGDYFRELQSGPKVIVTETFAHRRQIDRENAQITLLTDRGEQVFEVIGVYYDYTSDQGSVYMYWEVYKSYYDDPYISSIAAFIQPGADLGAVIGRLQDETLAGQDLEVQSNRQLREGAIEIFDRTFSITIALQVLAMIVAFIGILSALLALQLENIREYGIMRANGMTGGQLRRFTLLQTSLMGVISGLLAMPTGLALAYILVYVINVRSFGWSMDLRLPPEEFLQAFGVAVLAAVLAGLYPAWKVTRIQAAEAIRTE